jgi:hypothetical protein
MPGCQYIYKANALAYFEASSIRKKSFFIDGTFLLMLLQEQQKSCFVVRKFFNMVPIFMFMRAEEQDQGAQWAERRHKDKTVTLSYCHY